MAPSAITTELAPATLTLQSHKASAGEADKSESVMEQTPLEAISHGMVMPGMLRMLRRTCHILLDGLQTVTLVMHAI
jgi:hypothetical protein